MKNPIIFSFIIFLFGSHLLIAQTKWILYDKDYGLASTWVRDCMEDQNGTMWFATDKGLNKLEGSHFITYDKKDGLSGGFVNGIYEDTCGNIWILSGRNSMNILWGTMKYKDIGVGILPPSQRQINTLNLRQKKYKFGVIKQDLLGNVWVGGYNQKEKKSFIAKNFDGISWERLSQNNFSDCLPFANFFIDKAGKIWTVTIPGESKKTYIQRFDGKQWSSFGTKDGLDLRTRERSFKIIFEDSKNNIWFGSADTRQIGSIITRIGCLLKYDGRNWINYSERGEITGKSIINIMEDNEGKIWVSTNNGVNVFDGNSWKLYSTEELIPGSFFEANLVDSKGRVWVGSSKGLTTFEQNKHSFFDKTNGLVENFVRCIYEDTQGNIWVGAAPNWLQGGGVSVFDGEKWTKMDIPEVYPSTFFEDSKGNMWVLTFGKGIVKIKGGFKQ